MEYIINIAGELTQLVNLLSFATLALIALGVQVFFRAYLLPEVAHKDDLFIRQMTIRERRLRNIVETVEKEHAEQKIEIEQFLAEVRRLNVVRYQLESGQKQLRAQLDLAMRKGQGQQHVIRQLLGKSQQIDQIQDSLKKRDALIHFMLKQKKVERQTAKAEATRVAQANQKSAAHNHIVQTQADAKIARLKVKQAQEHDQVRSQVKAQVTAQIAAQTAAQVKRAINRQSHQTNVTLFPVDFKQPSTPPTAANTEQAVVPKTDFKSLPLNALTSAAKRFQQWGKQQSDAMFASSSKVKTSTGPALIPVSTPSSMQFKKAEIARAPLKAAQA